MKTVYLFMVSICCLLGMTACGGSSVRQKPIQSVRVDSVIANSDKSIIQYPGRVRAAQDVNLAFRVSGTIQSILVEDGAYVKAGQLLAELDPSDYQIQLDATEAKYKEVKSEADRVIALYNDGGTTPNNYDKAVYGLQQITALYQHHKDELAYTRLYAPFNGYIQKNLFEAHETVAAGMPVLSMIGSGTPEVEINLPAAEYIRREQFSEFYCTFDLYPGSIYPLKLIGITPKANANQLYTIRLQLQPGDRPVPSPGMNTMVSIYYQDSDVNMMRVPSGALHHADGKVWVFVYSPETKTVQHREVSVIRPLSDGKSIISSSQLRAGELVVSGGVNFIKDGETVRLVNPISDTNIGGLL